MRAICAGRRSRRDMVFGASVGMYSKALWEGPFCGGAGDEMKGLRWIR